MVTTPHQQPPERPANGLFCNASTDSTFVFMAECGRWAGHDGPHYDFDHDAEWDADGSVSDA